jgi:hypothetical protein
MRYAALALLVVALAAAVVSLGDDSLIVDEVSHIAAGYSYLHTGSLRLNPEHPPLVKEIAALPLLFMGLDASAFLPRHQENAVDDQWEQGRRFFYHSGNDPQRIARAARLMVLAFYAAGGVLVFAWARARHACDHAGTLAFILFAFAPSVLAHARYVTTDVPAAVGIFAALTAFLAYLRRASRGRLALAVAALGAALLIKFSAVLVVPWMLLAGALRGRRGVAAALVVSTLAGGLVVWPFYLLHMLRYSAKQQQRDTQEMLDTTLGDDAAARSVRWMSDKPALRAAGQYVAGVQLVIERSHDRHPVWFFGEMRTSGFLAYFPAALLLKETPVWWILLAGIAGGLLIVRPRLDRAFFDRRFEEIALVAWLLLYGAMCVRTSLNLGVRHLLPLFPVAAVLMGGACVQLVRRLGERRRGGAIPVAALAAGHILSTLCVHPSYLAYFSPLAGGPTQGHRYLVDSNLDWGQDLGRLARWVRAHDVTRIEVDYFGGGDVGRELGTTAVTHARADDWLAVSATRLVQRPDRDVLLAREPAAVIGHSIFVWKGAHP